MDGSERSSRWRARIVAAVVVGAVAWPVVGRDDSFPLSTYPMFSRDRGRVVELATVIAVDPAGEVRRLSPEAIADTDQPILASTVVSRAVAAGRAAADELCVDVAGRAGRLDGEAIEVVVERHDTRAWAEGGDDAGLLERRVVARC